MPSSFQTGLDLRAGATTAGNAFGANMLVVQDISGNPTLMTSQPIVTGRWVEYNMTINLIANKFDMQYDGLNVVSGAQWDTTPGDGVTFGGIDFWMQIGNANGINNAVYYDDFRLVEVPEPSSLVLAPLGLLLLKLRRKQPAVSAPVQF
ncbi:MAG: PEP-CTERM sorting domain-containing protein [Verrucomicrobiota bacterium]